ncbi:hypothetical protein RRG08_026040 [Elysia crispata]|uniref:Uncharacterized protein n=1 Tax=Elysia crispata TaxID=231223 RepID=A0AAE0Z032_9GAST|nr:hypothetical protein RRG08_026040 [Elysia crispata]
MRQCTLFSLLDASADTMSVHRYNNIQPGGCWEQHDAPVYTVFIARYVYRVTQLSVHRYNNIQPGGCWEQHDAPVYTVFIARYVYRVTQFLGFGVARPDVNQYFVLMGLQWVPTTSEGCYNKNNFQFLPATFRARRFKTHPPAEEMLTATVSYLTYFTLSSVWLESILSTCERGLLEGMSHAADTLQTLSCDLSRRGLFTCPLLPPILNHPLTQVTLVYTRPSGYLFSEMTSSIAWLGAHSGYYVISSGTGPGLEQSSSTPNYVTACVHREAGLKLSTPQRFCGGMRL